MSLLLALFACRGGGETLPDAPGGGAPADTPAEHLEAVDGTIPAEGPDTCDAGTAAWVQRVLPFVLGRRARGAAEVQMWTAVADAHGRDVVVRAMTTDPGYLLTWRPILADLLLVSRSGSDADATCHQYPLLGGHDGALARHIRGFSADEAPFGAPFNMADVLIDSLVADDLAAAWQANVFARTNYVPICANTTDPYQIESERRLALGDEFLENYTNRSVTCMVCHNSEWSTTDAVDPNEDRTWGVAGALFEKSLFDSSYGPDDVDGFYSMFRYAGVVEDRSAFGNPAGSFPVRPWGWSDTCGTFDPAPMDEDYLGVESGYFLGPFGPEGSLFDVAEQLRTGADALAAGPLVVEPDGLVPPDQALAWLTGQHLADRIWALGTGSPLTVPYGFSRNREQSEILASLTSRFLASGWSLQELLVAVATEPHFNAGLPETCGMPPYAMDPVLDPWSVEDPNPALHGNGPGDLVHRQYARVLVNSANHALGWGAEDEYFSLFGGDDALATAIGIFLNRSEAGFSGTDLQGALAWETRFGTCFDATVANDFLAAAIDDAVLADDTLESVLLVLKDRLLADGRWDSDAERALVESLLETPLDTPMIDAPEGTRRNIGLFCGALTMSPRFFLAVEPHPPGPVPPRPIGAEEDCERLRIDLLTQGIRVTCNGWMPESE